jgi:hypothetical protein
VVLKAVKAGKGAYGYNAYPRPDLLTVVSELTRLAWISMLRES